MTKGTDATGERILKVLLGNSRLSYRAIARKAEISVATAINRARSMEKAGIIKRHTIEIDYEKLGYEFDVAVFIRVSKGDLSGVEKKISMHKSVYAVYDVTGAFDVIVLARFMSRRELNSFVKRLQKIENIERTQTNLILNRMETDNY